MHANAHVSNRLPDDDEDNFAYAQDNMMPGPVVAYRNSSSSSYSSHSNRQYERHIINSMYISIVPPRLTVLPTLTLIMLDRAGGSTFEPAEV